jgi:hypothetical protein
VFIEEFLDVKASGEEYLVPESSDAAVQHCGNREQNSKASGG